MKPKRNYRRGYPVAILVGLEEHNATLWKIFSNIIKPENTIQLNGTRNNPKALYNFHESIINALRPTLKEGVRSIIISSPARTNYAQEFINHVRGHHAWLMQGANKASLSEIIGSAGTRAEVAALTRNPTFHQLICETTQEETENLIDILESRLNKSSKDTLVLYSLEEAENLILGLQKPNRPNAEYLMFTDKYLADSRQKNRLHRLLQIATNKNVKTRIINAESPAGLRLTQLGGIVCLTRFE